jgi:hypothetical protein
LWVMSAHMLVRPGLIEHLRVEVCSKGTRPTADGIAHVISVLARRHGHVPSRMAAGKRTWRQVDVFSIASTQTLGAHYCGSHKINAQLLQYEKLESIALKIASYRGQTVDFGDIVGAIGGSGLACYAPRGYWTVHLARVFVPRFGGITLLDGVRYSPECARVLYKMGSGASSMILLGITEVNVYDRGLALCKCIVSLGKRLGLHVSMDFAHLACAVCEAHGRHVLPSVWLVTSDSMRNLFWAGRSNFFQALAAQNGRVLTAQQCIDSCGQYAQRQRRPERSLCQTSSTARATSDSM